MSCPFHSIKLRKCKCQWTLLFVSNPELSRVCKSWRWQRVPHGKMAQGQDGTQTARVLWHAGRVQHGSYDTDSRVQHGILWRGRQGEAAHGTLAIPQLEVAWLPTWLFLPHIWLQTFLNLQDQDSTWEQRMNTDNWWHLMLFCHLHGLKKPSKHRLDSHLVPFSEKNNFLSMIYKNLDAGIHSSSKARWRRLFLNGFVALVALASDICPPHYPCQALLHFFLQKHLSDPINLPPLHCSCTSTTPFKILFLTTSQYC